MLRLLVLALVPLGALTFEDPANFDKDVLQDKHVWLIEFSSKQCSGCNEFKPEWEKLVGQLKRVKTAHVDVDGGSGKALAEQLGVLEEGLPNVKLFMKEGGADQALTLVRGEVSSARKLKLELKPLFKGLEKEGGNGAYLKGEGGLAFIKSGGPCIEHSWCPVNIPRTADDTAHSNCNAWALACPCTCEGYGGERSKETSANKSPGPNDKQRKAFLGRFTGAVVDSVRKYEKFVAAEPRVHTVLFYAGRSGESKVFSRTWEALTFGMKRVTAATVDIETEGGRALAEKLGVVAEGLPNIKLLAQKDAPPITLMAEKLRTKKQLRAALKPLLKGLAQDDFGYFLKADEADAAADEL